MSNPKQIGFIGLGVMGEPICRNLARKSGAPVLAFDLSKEPLERLAADGVKAVASPAEVMQQCDVVFLSLPSGEVVAKLSRESNGLLANARAGQVVVDLSTSSVNTTRELSSEFESKGAHLVDAPVARTRAAAEAGTLAVFVGATPELFEQVRPLIATFAADIALCGPVGCGQVLKILNNMMLFAFIGLLAVANQCCEKTCGSKRSAINQLQFGNGILEG